MIQNQNKYETVMMNELNNQVINFEHLTERKAQTRLTKNYCIFREESCLPNTRQFLLPLCQL